MSWENVIKVERDQQFPQLLNIGERIKLPKTVTVGEEPSDDDLQARGISESFFYNLEESFLNDIYELLPEVSGTTDFMSNIEKIEEIYDKLLALEFLMYKEIPTNKKQEYLTDIKNKIVNEIFYLVIKPTLDSGATPIPPYPPPNAPLKIYQDRPDIKDTILKPDPRLPKVGEEIPGYVDDPKTGKTALQRAKEDYQEKLEDLGIKGKVKIKQVKDKLFYQGPSLMVEETTAGMISDRFAEQAGEVVMSIATQISRILRPYVRETTQGQRTLPKGDKDIPRKEPIVPTKIRSEINFSSLYDQLKTIFEGSVTVKKNKYGMQTNLSARTIENFGELVERQIAQLQLDEGIDLGKVGGAINTTQPKYNQPPLKVISRKFKQATNVQKRRFSSIDYFFTKLAEMKHRGDATDAKYREIIDGIGVSMYNILVAIYEMEYDDTNVVNLPAILGRKRGKLPDKPVMPTFTFILGGKEYDYSVESAKEIQQIYAEGLKNNQTFAETREILTRPEREKLKQERKIMAQKEKEFDQLLQEIEENKRAQLEYMKERGKADAQDVASGQKELKDISESLANIAGVGINIGEVETVVDGIEKPVDRTQELNERFNKTKEELNIKFIPAFGPEEQELSERIRGTPLPKRARDATAKIDPKYLSEKEYNETEKKLKDSQRAKKKLGAIERAKSKGRDIKLTPEKISELEDEVLSSKEETDLKNKLQSHQQALVLFDATSGKKRKKESQRPIHIEGPKKGQPFTDEEIEAARLRYGTDITDPFKDIREGTKKALDTLLTELGVTSDTIVKEDTGMILNELNKKDKRLVKTLLQLAHPTEYFNEDVLKLGELITVLKSLGVVNENKGLKKRILKYEDENLMVVKRAVKLRREYEKLYKSIREVIYPKTGDDNE